ncbi:MAG TPA: hypothetical protein VKS21_12480 [Spirochaetota bacterium]|nr:hypothetical protein [Spirochaetota bacterium]
MIQNFNFPGKGFPYYNYNQGITMENKKPAERTTRINGYLHKIITVADSAGKTIFSILILIMV